MRSFASAEDFLNSGQQHETGCLITDIRMPGMSGLDLQAKLNADHCPIPTIFITAHGDEKMRLQAMRGGAVKFLAKPFDGAILLEAFEWPWIARAKTELSKVLVGGTLWNASKDLGPATKTTEIANLIKSSATVAALESVLEKLNGSRPPTPLC